MRISNYLLGCFAATCVAQVEAAPTWSITKEEIYSTQVGAIHETFDAAAVNPNDTLNLAFTGGALVSGLLERGFFIPPVGSTGNYLSVGISPGQLGPVEIDLSSGPARYYGFLWGSPDRYNTVAFYDGATLLVQLSGEDVSPLSKNTFYFNAFAGVGEKFTRVVFDSSGNAFETDNHAIVPVTAPGTYALTLAALGLLAAGSRVRKAS